MASDGVIFGYRALVPHARIDSYTRRAPVKHILGDMGAGCSGALGQLFNRFPELESHIVELFLAKPKQKTDEARITVTRLHAKILTWLRDHGLSDTEWPFNTKSAGAETFRRYCQALIESRATRWLAARAGPEAARRSGIGKGFEPLFKANRLFTCVQLDFHKVDSASIITITNSHDVDVDIPLARWHIGALIDEKSTLILGATIALEITPSSDSVLETVECALVPLVEKNTNIALAIGLGTKVFPNQLLQQLSGHGFSIIKMDNGLSNTAIVVLENLIDVVGCAVNLGPVRKWWIRHEIEALFGKATRAALQASPSTYGSGPTDTKRNDPAGTALRLKIRLTDIVRAVEQEILSHNANRTEHLEMGSPLATLQVALDNYESLYLPAPLPKPICSPGGIPLLCYKTMTLTIRGNIKKGVRAYVKIGRWCYTNPRLASDFNLIDSNLKVYCSLRDARIVYASLCTTGEVIGQLSPPASKTNVAVSFRLRAKQFSNGADMRRKEMLAAQAAGWSGIAPESPALNSAEALRMVKDEVTRPHEKTRPNAPQIVARPIDRNGGMFNLDMPAPITRKK
jgi:hypothetical protein